MPKFEQPKINQENLNDGLEYPTENEAGFDGLASGINPDLDDDVNKPEETKTEIEQENSQQIAQEKLEILKSPEFKEFAIRFMTQEEYAKMMTAGQFMPGREVYVFNETNGNSVSFAEYLDENKGDWREAIYKQTEWSHGNVDLNMADEFLKGLRKAHEKVLQESSDKKDIRKKVLVIFRENLENYLKQLSLESNPYVVKSDVVKAYEAVSRLVRLQQISNVFKTVNESSNPFETLENLVNDEGEYKQEVTKDVDGNGGITFYVMGTPIRVSSQTDIDNINLKIKKESEGLSEFSSEMLAEEKNKLQKIYGEQLENIGIISNFFGDPEWINEGKDNLRKLFDVLVYFKQEGKRQEDSQYHIGIVLGLPAVMTGRIDNDLLREEWGRITTKGDYDYKQSEHIMGAVALMTDKSLVGLMESLQAQAGTLSHPVFDRNGHVMYPKNK
ncbi:MAG: hypothetical protein Q7T49_00655 [bacterium]|nr:hypothetical protein [bacterium]